MKRREGGFVLAALLILLLISGIAALLGGNQLATRVEFQYHHATIAELAHARAALIGYAQSYRLTHPNQSVGYLPCPDTNSGNDDGNAEGSCGYKGEFSIGRFPYRTLGLPPLRDGYGECLWYAVAGSFKNNPKKGGLNWDTDGQFEISNEIGLPKLGTQSDRAAVAVIFAPGRPLAGQDRGSSTRRCSGDANAASALPAYLEGNYVIPGNLPVAIARGSPADSAKNDLVAWITAYDIFSEHFVKAMLDSLESAISAHPNPRPVAPFIVGNIETGAFPLPIPAPEPSNTEKVINEVLDRYASWSDQFHYFRCINGSSCLTVIDDSTGFVSNCSAAFVFSGRALPGQVRKGSGGATAAYYEGANIEAVDNITGNFVGPPNYSVTHPEKDVVRCLS